MMSMILLNKMTNRLVFFSDKCNKCERQATRKGYLGHERAKHVDIQVVHMRVSTISAAAVVFVSAVKKNV